MTEVDTHYKYWQEKKNLGRFAYRFMAKAPHKWFNEKNRTNELEEFCSGLETNKWELAQQWGYVARISYELRLELNLKAITARMNTIAVGIRRVLNPGVAPKPAESLSTYAELLAQIIENIEDMDAYKTCFQQNIESLKMPGHFERNWLRYTIGTVLAVGAACAVYKNRAELVESAHQLADGVPNVFNNYIKAPFNKLCGFFIDEKVKKDTPEAKDLVKRLKSIGDSKGLKYTQEYYAGMVGKQESLDFLIAQLPEPARLKATQDFTKWLAEQGGGMTIWNIGEAIVGFKPVIGACSEFPEIAAAFLPALNEFGKAKGNDSGFLITCVQNTPGLAAVWSAKWVACQGYGAVKDSFAIDYRKLSNPLIELERILNRNYTEQQLSDEERGYLLYYLLALKKRLAIIPDVQVRQDFARDVAEIESAEFSIVQKLNTVQRMYRVYDFLAPSSVK